MYEDVIRGRVKKSLFDQYRENLTIFAEHANEQEVKKLFVENEIVLCPICLNGFHKSHLKEPKDRSNYLTLEHVPPQSVGYTVEALTCFECNNGSSKQDEALKFMSSDPSKQRHQVLMEVNGLQFNAIYTFDSKLDVRFTNAKDVPIFVGLVNSGHKFNMLGLNNKPAYGANMLKISYLLAFATFGYGLILHPGYDVIRKHIKKPYEKHIEGFGFLMVKSLDEELPCGVFYVAEPKELASICVRFKTTTEVYGVIQENIYTYCLPSPRSDVNAFYKLLDEQSKMTNYKITSINESVDYWFDPYSFYHVVRMLDGYSKGLISQTLPNTKQIAP